MFDSPLTLTGVIATVLAVVFAIAALLNTRRRHQAMAQVPPAANPADTRSGTRVTFDVGNTGKQSVFKKVGPNGQPAEPLQTTQEHVYAWE
ncbi:MAG TPA: hypothetical protein P5567_07250 [Kiritimatiellia bacterium]|nr:hypothetical protein [Kiritimatiellia bacterium]